MASDLAILDRNKQICTGVSLETASEPNLSPLCSTEEAFDSLVTEYYTFFRECNVADVAFLRSVDNHRLIAEFDNAINLLRTAKQHQDNPNAEQFYKEWVGAHVDWQAASDSLAADLQKALGQLARISTTVRRDLRLTQSWKERISIEPEAVFQSVCLDLKTVFRHPRDKMLIGNVKKRAKWLRPDDDTRARLEDLCAQEISSQYLSLPVPYHEVLDKLGLLGSPKARAALLLAYSVSASTGLRGEDFLVRVEKAWCAALS